MTFKFWTKKEDELLEKAYNDYSGNMAKAARSLDGKIGRTYTSIQARMHIKFGKKRLPKTENKAVTLPPGFSFTINTPREVKLEEGKIIIFI